MNATSPSRYPAAAAVDGRIERALPTPASPKANLVIETLDEFAGGGSFFSLSRADYAIGAPAADARN